MIWFYERRHDRLHYEIRLQPDGTAYELVISHPDGHQEIERFTEPSALVQRATLLKVSLSEAGWEPPRRTRARASA